MGLEQRTCSVQAAGRLLLSAHPASEKDPPRPKGWLGCIGATSNGHNRRRGQEQDCAAPQVHVGAGETPWQGRIVLKEKMGKLCAAEGWGLVTGATGSWPSAAHDPGTLRR